NSLGINNYAAKLQQTSLIDTGSETWNSLTGTLYISASEFITLWLSFWEPYEVTSPYSAWSRSYTYMSPLSDTRTYYLQASVYTVVSLTTTLYFSDSTYTYLTGYASTGRYTINLPSDFAVYALEKYTDTMNLSLIGFGTGFSETLRVGSLSAISGSDGIWNTNSTSTYYTFYTTFTTYFSTRLTFQESLSSTSRIYPSDSSMTFSLTASVWGTATLSGTFSTDRSSGTFLTINTSTNTIISLAYRPAFAATATDDMNLMNTDRLDILQPSKGVTISAITSFSKTGNPIVTAASFGVSQLAPLSFGVNALGSQFTKTTNLTLNCPFRVLFVDSDSVSNGLYIVSGSLTWAGNSQTRSLIGIQSTKRHTLLKGSSLNPIAFEDLNFI
uniref:hypothetical protein n=1 Tax=Synechococcus sp. UW106 TaxID=368495 RepID=UPI00148399F4